MPILTKFSRFMPARTCRLGQHWGCVLVVETASALEPAAGTRPWLAVQPVALVPPDVVMHRPLV